MTIEIKQIKQKFSVCKVSEVPEALLKEEFCFIGKTDEELSLVCETDKVPEGTLAREDGWRAFRIEGILDFSLIGILAPIADLLAENRIGIFAVSTYNTDYILVKQENFDRALSLLAEKGYRVS